MVLAGLRHDGGKAVCAKVLELIHVEAKVHALVLWNRGAAHGGGLELNDAPKSFHEGRGAMITITLPAADAAATPPSQGGAKQTKENEKVSNGV